MPLKVSEADLLRAVCQLADLKGWKWWHFSDSRRPGPRGSWVGDPGAAGFPDLVLAHPRHGLVFAELKSARGRLRPVQTDALEVLSAAVVSSVPKGMKVHVWRPADMDSGLIDRVLSGEPDVDRFIGWNAE